MKARWTVRWSAVLIIALFMLPLAVSAAPPTGPSARIDPRALLATSKGEAKFWIVMRTHANLNASYNIKDWKTRGSFVVDQLQAAANASQAGVRAYLQGRGKKYQPFWIANAILVTADSATLKELGARPDVAEILNDEPIPLPVDLPGKAEPTVNATEWGLDRIRAPLVWSTFNDRGDGIVVATIDTGAMYNHPALVRQYRGNLGGGTFNHNYNWFDPANACATPSVVPCDNNGHGTHTMGTIVGDDGDPGTNQVGVAPHARWIAAKGCESSSCSTASLLAAGQWVLAPTDLNGQNPRADLRPNIVSNSWGSNSGTDTFYQATVQAWVASGMFPAFANGNAGPGCGTVGAPGSYPEAYGVGAFDINNAIASFSSRGPAPGAVGGQIKPNISAPGVNIRSSWNDGAYNTISGTSMATPHLAGAVALMWSAAPTLIGDIAATRALLNQTAIDTSDLTCGGTAANNNVWGEGRLDVFAAVDLAPRGPTGMLQGTVTNTSNAPIAGASVRAIGPSDRTATADAAGHYSFQLPIGSYNVTASAFGYTSQTANGLSITQGMTTTHDFPLVAAPAHPVSGYVRDTFSQAIANATVTIQGTPIAPATTDANGFYSFASVPDGTYNVQAAAGRCVNSQTQSLTVNANATLNFALVQRSDSYGYYCRVEPSSYISATTVLPLTGDDAVAQVSLPFPFTFYGQTYNSAYVATNGYMNFLASNSSFSNGAIPSSATPNGAIYPFWDDMNVDSGTATVRTQLLGNAPTRRFVIEWRNVRFFSTAAKRVGFEVVLHENGQILIQYADIANDAQEQGNSATLGIENATGTVALQYSNNEAVLTNNLAVRYRLPPTSFVEGHVTDANDHLTVAGATVVAMQGSSRIRSTTTDANGLYRLLLPLSSYTVNVGATNYITGTATANLQVEDGVVTQDFVLSTPRATISPTSYQFILPAGQTRTKLLTLSNSGSAPLTWSIVENPAAAWITESSTGGSLTAIENSASPRRTQTSQQGISDSQENQSIDITVSSAGLTSGVYDTTLLVQSNSGRQPSLSIPVRLIVPAYRTSVNAGGAAYTDREGDLWGADRAYAAGSYGYYDSQARAVSVSGDILGTSDDPLYRSMRQSPMEYRFDGLPNGVYQVELLFAEIENQAPGKRLYDVIIEGNLVLPALDIALEVGSMRADPHTFYVPVTDGQLNIRFVERLGYKPPIVNAIRVTHRPDK